MHFWIKFKHDGLHKHLSYFFYSKIYGYIGIHLLIAKQNLIREMLIGLNRPRSLYYFKTLFLPRADLCRCQDVNSDYRNKKKLNVFFCKNALNMKMRKLKLLLKII